MVGTTRLWRAALMGTVHLWTSVEISVVQPVVDLKALQDLLELFQGLNQLRMLYHWF